MKKSIFVLAVCFCLSTIVFAQASPNAFATTSFSFNLTPITLPNVGTTLAGAETDAMFAFTANNLFGETTLIGNSTFIGGRYERVVPSIAKYLQAHTSLTGSNFQAGLTTSLGVTKASGNSYWAGRAGLFLRWAPAGSTSFNIVFEAQANYLPNFAGPNTPHWIPSIAVGPNFRF